MARSSSLNCLWCIEILAKPLIHWIASALFTEKPFFSLKSALSHPLPKNRLWLVAVSRCFRLISRRVVASSCHWRLFGAIPQCLSAPQRCNAQRSDAQRKFFTNAIHRCDALPCFSASPVDFFYIARIALRPLLPFFLSPQWFTVQNNKKFAKSHNAAMSPLATRDGQRNAQRTTQRCGALSSSWFLGTVAFFEV